MDGANAVSSLASFFMSSVATLCALACAGRGERCERAAGWLPLGERCLGAWGTRGWLGRTTGGFDSERRPGVFVGWTATTRGAEGARRWRKAGEVGNCAGF